MKEAQGSASSISFRWRTRVEKTNAEIERKISHGSRIFELRKEKGLTQLQLAMKIGKSEQVIRAVEKGRSKLAVEAALKLFELYGYSLDWLYGLSEVNKLGENKFLVDIRKLIQFNGDNIQIRINAELFDYLKQLGQYNSQRASGELSAEAYNKQVVELDSKYMGFIDKGAHKTATISAKTMMDTSTVDREHEFTIVV